MNLKNYIFFLLIAFSIKSNAQTNPAITGWLLNTDGTTGTYYMSGNPTLMDNNVLINCQKVEYSSDFAYISTNGVPAYPTGPFGGNPSITESQDVIYKISLNPQENNGPLFTTTGGNIGIFVNGVALFDYRDGAGWDTAANAECGGPMNPDCPGPGLSGVDWTRDAVWAEMGGFDCSKGHPANGKYHHHQNPSAFKLDLDVLSNICNTFDADGLYTIDPSEHSPLIGFAYDGFPIYGAYGYANADGTGGITRIKSGYQLRNISTRTHHADGTDVDDGPDVGGTYFLGFFREDYEFITHAGEDYLDDHNGRFCVTPEYPNGTYAYFATVDEEWNSAYPYVIGPYYYGVKNGGAVNSITETVMEYIPSSGIHVDEAATGSNDGSSWENAFTDLQDALAVGSGEEIFIAQGTYKPTSGTSRAIFFNPPSNVTILGGYPTGGGPRDIAAHPTILSGDVDGDGTGIDNSFHVVRLQNVSGVTLDGITIQGGNADNAASFARSRGGGIYSTGSTLTLHECTVTANKAVYGGGMFATLSNAVNIDYSEIIGNEADYGSALYHSNETMMYIKGTRILDNNSTVRCAIEINNSLYTSIENSVIANNASTNANAIAFIATNRDQTCDILNSTILGETKNKNLITLQIGFGDQLDVNISNSVVAHQTSTFSKAFQAYNNNILNLNTTNCYVQGSTVIGTSTNNLYSAAAGDLMLNADYSVSNCSPVVDAGNDASASGLTTDINGDNRFFGMVDIGAYEAQSSCGSLAKEITKTRNEKNSIGDVKSIELFPNPANEFIAIQVGNIVKEDLNVSLYTIKGELILSKKLYKGSTICTLGTFRSKT